MDGVRKFYAELREYWWLPILLAVLIAVGWLAAGRATEAGRKAGERSRIESAHQELAQEAENLSGMSASSLEEAQGKLLPFMLGSSRNWRITVKGQAPVFEGTLIESVDKEGNTVATLTVEHLGEHRWSISPPIPEEP